MKLRTDERGAIMLMGLFMAVLLAGALYHVMGIGEAILHRERMQDAADVAAYNGAVMHAHGMNLLVLLNMVMAALLAVLVTLKLVETIAIALMLAIGLASFLAPGLATAIPELEGVRRQVRKVHDQTSKVIYPALEGLHATSRAIRVVVPWAAQARVLQQSRAHYAPPAELALSFPSRATLPVEDDEFGTLCERAGDYTGDLVSLPFAFVPQGGILGDAFDSAVEDLTEGGASWFCGASSAPRTTVDRRIGYPQIPARRACLAMEPGTRGYDGAEHERRCDAAEQQEQTMGFDPETGACLEQCDEGGPYDERDATARRDCDPRAWPGRRNFVWQEQRVTYRVQNVSGELTRSIEDPPDRFARTSKRTPCGQRNAPVSERWESRQRDEDGALIAVCSDGNPFPQYLAPGEERMVMRREVLRMLACEQVEKKQVGVDDGGRPTAKDNARRVPQRVLPDAHLGEEDFQLRSLALGGLPRTAPERALSVSAWGRAPARATSLETARQLGRVAVAQAEYHFDGKERVRFMWEMRWRARLRRVRPPGRGGASNDDAYGAPGETATTVARACTLAGISAERCEGLSPELSALVIH